MREYQVRICERLGVKFPGPTRQTEKNSVRAYVFRFALELGHCSMQSALRICAKSRHHGCHQLTNIRAATLTILGLLSELQGGGDHECRWTGIYFAALRTLMLTPSRLPSEELDTGHCRLHRAVPVDAIRPFPKHCLQGGGNILRPGCIGCMTFGNPVPSHAGHSTSGTLGLHLFIKNLS